MDAKKRVDRGLQERRAPAGSSGRPILVNFHAAPTSRPARRFPTASMTSPGTRGMSASGSPATPHSSRARASARGGSIGQMLSAPARSLTITADAGGSNSYRIRLSKTELQKLADRTRIAITIYHYPPRNQQVEQDPAPPVQLHLNQLAREAPRQPTGRNRPDHRDHHQHRPEGLRPTRREYLPHQNQSHRRAARHCADRAKRVPSRMELHHSSR